MEDLDKFGTETVVRMMPGMIYEIDPYVFHRVDAEEQGSVSVPIKRLKKGVKDHVYMQPGEQ